MKAADWSDTLTGEMLVCGVLARALYAGPDKTWLESLRREQVFSDVPFAASQPHAASALGELRAWSDAPLDVDALVSDYNHLFVGPAKLLAAPWESVYVDRERMLFQRTTLEVKSWYERFGLERKPRTTSPRTISDWSSASLRISHSSVRANVTMSALHDCSKRSGLSWRSTPSAGCRTGVVTSKSTLAPRSIAASAA
jgi:hypothetical protein